MKHTTNLFINQSLFREEKIEVTLGVERDLDGSIFRCLQIDDLLILLTTAQAMQIAAAITNQFASEIEQGVA